MNRCMLGVALAAILLLSACGASRTVQYEGPEVTRVVVLKEARRLYLLHNDTVLAGYDISLGFAPEGHKLQTRDGRTPEGHYVIDRRNPDSSFHFSLGISYPNPADVARARAAGVDPGGDIFIHGWSPAARRRGPDWTWGCIAVRDREIEQIYAMVRTGTPISIYR